MLFFIANRTESYNEALDHLSANQLPRKEAESLLSSFLATKITGQKGGHGQVKIMEDHLNNKVAIKVVEIEEMRCDSSMSEARSRTIAAVQNEIVFSILIETRAKEDEVQVEFHSYYA